MINQFFFQALAAISVAIGVCIAAYQLFRLKQIQRDDHVWNQKIEAQKALEARQHLDTSVVNDAFGPIRNDRIIEATELKEKLKDGVKYPNLRTDLHKLLNYYEGLARGIYQDMYDEKVIKLARKKSILSLYHKYENYITFRQKHRNERAYYYLSKLALHWLEEDNL
jgi:hypothetical protein